MGLSEDVLVVDGLYNCLIMLWVILNLVEKGFVCV